MFSGSEEIKNTLANNGFAIINDVFTETEVHEIITLISEAESSRPTFRQTNDLFAIRQFLKEIPQVYNLIFNKKFKSLISGISNEDFFITKSIYFDKPEKSNWFVSYHQDLTISVNKRVDLNDFQLWTKKHNQFSVQPPLDILKTNFTLRIHLDDTDEKNGALRVIPKSHLKNICRPETINLSQENSIVCKVKKGGVMLMKPLLLHSSNKTLNNKRRRVIHIEFSNCSLPKGLEWSEQMFINFQNNW